MDPMDDLPEYVPTHNEYYRHYRQRRAQWLLAHSLRDLRARTEPSASEYEVLGISVILRRLLIEGAASMALEQLDVPKPVFRCTPFDAQASYESDARRLVIGHKSSSFAEATVALTAERFIRASIGRYGSRPLSVGEVVKLYAHVLGGVHSGHAKSELEETVLWAAVSANAAKQLRWDQVLQEIAIVTLAAYEPIEPLLAESLD